MEKDLQNNEEIFESEEVATEEVHNVTENNSPEVEQVFAEDELAEEGTTQDVDIASLQERIVQLEKEVEEKDNKLLRTQADFDNFRRRTRQENENNEKYRSQQLALEILPAVDNFERALQVEAKGEEAQSLLKGMEMIYTSIIEALKKEGIEQIESVGKEFNPEFHHAVMQDHVDDKEVNTVLEEFQKGYKLRDRVIRPAMVKVNQ